MGRDRRGWPMERRLMDKVSPEPNTGCWLWTGATTGSMGYGVLGTTVNGVRHRHWAHRTAYELFRGPVPTGLNVCHHCDTPICVNPDHLYAATQAVNLQHMHDRNRHPRPRRAA